MGVVLPVVLLIDWIVLEVVFEDVLKLVWEIVWGIVMAVYIVGEAVGVREFVELKLVLLVLLVLSIKTMECGRGVILACDPPQASVRCFFSSLMAASLMETKKTFLIYLGVVIKIISVWCCKKNCIYTDKRQVSIKYQLNVS